MELASCGAVGHRQQGGTKAFRSPLSPVPEAWAESLEQEEGQEEEEIQEEEGEKLGEEEKG